MRRTCFFGVFIATSVTSTPALAELHWPTTIKWTVVKEDGRSVRTGKAKVDVPSDKYLTFVQLNRTIRVIDSTGKEKSEQENQSLEARLVDSQNNKVEYSLRLVENGKTREHALVDTVTGEPAKVTLKNGHRKVTFEVVADPVKD